MDCRRTRARKHRETKAKLHTHASATHAASARRAHAPKCTGRSAARHGTSTNTAFKQRGWQFQASPHSRHKHNRQASCSCTPSRHGIDSWQMLTPKKAGASHRDKDTQWTTHTTTTTMHNNDRPTAARTQSSAASTGKTGLQHSGPRCRTLQTTTHAQHGGRVRDGSRPRSLQNNAAACTPGTD